MPAIRQRRRPSTPTTAAARAHIFEGQCITKAETKAVASIDKVCVAVPGNPPCYAPDMSGADWIAIGEGAVDVVATIVYCGSPSAAFLD